VPVAFVACRKDSRLHFALHDTACHFIMWDDLMWFFNGLDAFVADPSARVQTREF